MYSVTRLFIQMAMGFISGPDAEHFREEHPKHMAEPPWNTTTSEKVSVITHQVCKNDRKENSFFHKVDYILIKNCNDFDGKSFLSPINVHFIFCLKEIETGLVSSYLN